MSDTPDQLTEDELSELVAEFEPMLRPIFEQVFKLGFDEGYEAARRGPIAAILYSERAKKW